MSAFNKEKVCAVVVTFNRKQLLKECLELLISQSRPLDTILIVDNASSDNTSQLLFDSGYIEECPPESKEGIFETESIKYVNGYAGESLKIVYICLHENTGGAGGFCYGQMKAYELGFDWIWLMDDDGKPTVDCLEKMLAKSYEACLHVLNPLVINDVENELLSFGLSKSIKTVEDANKYKDKFNLIKELANPFNGSLIHRKIISKIGFIKKEMFIWGDESEYFKRVLKSGESFATVVDAHFFHPATKTIYKTKFGFLKIPTKPSHLEMNFYRNQGYINRKYGRLVSHRIILKVVLFYLLEGDFYKAYNAMKYYIDGFFDKYNLPCI